MFSKKKPVLILLFLMLINCKDNQNKKESGIISVIGQNKVIDNICKSFNDVEIDKYIVVDSITAEYKLNNIDTLQEKLFSTPEKEHIVKEYEEYYQKGNQYYLVDEFTYGNYQIKGLLFKGYADIVSAVFFQLNSYDSQGEIVDCLLLDNRFQFEIIYRNEFKISDNCLIEISKYEDEKLSQQVFYKITSEGKFKKVQ